MSVSSRSSVEDEAEVLDDSDSPLLYDILVYREWSPQPDTKTSEVNQNGDSASNEGWKDRVSSWMRWSGNI
jgi:hypothetical protein